MTTPDRSQVCHNREWLDWLYSCERPDRRLIPDGASPDQERWIIAELIEQYLDPENSYLIGRYREQVVGKCSTETCGCNKAKQ